jgi:uncharacterized protein (DUF1697 family)
MNVVIAMLRGVNVGPHNRIRMEDLRALCGTLKLRDAQTYVQSGNVIFRTMSAIAQSSQSASKTPLRKNADFAAMSSAVRQRR